MRSPSPEEQTSPSLGRPSQGRLLRRLLPGLAGAWMGGAAALRPAPRRCLAGGCCAGAGAGAAAGWRQQLHAGAGCAGLPQSASVQRRTTGRSSPPRRRTGLGHGGIQEPCLVYLLHVGQTQPEVAFLDHHGGHRTAQRPRRNLRRS